MTKTKLELKEKFQTNYSDPTDFASDARLLQSIWRDEQKIPINNERYITIVRKGKKYETKSVYGNFIDPVDASEYKNFLTDNIKNIVKRELEGNIKRKKKDKKVLRKDRLLENLLSSQPLAFNLFAELSLNKELTLKIFQSLFSDRIKTINNIEFEYSPGRVNPKFTNDNSAFDVFIEYTTNTGKGFFGIEVKYSESLKDKPARFRERYKDVALTSNIFTVEGISELENMPMSLEQIWRDHLLCLSMIPPNNNDYAEGMFIYLYPKDNTECSTAIKHYSKYFKSSEYYKNGIYPLEMETLVKMIKANTKSEWINAFYDRYLDFNKIRKYEKVLS